jgi:zinc protease
MIRLRADASARQVRLRASLRVRGSAGRARLRALLVATLSLTPFIMSAQTQPAPDRSQPPKTGPAPTLKLPAIQRQKLSNGLAVWLVEQHEVPIAQVNLIIGSGSADDPPERPGTASLAAAMLDEGAGTRGALELADAIEFLGAELNTSSTFDASAVRLNVPVARLSDALPLMADVVLRPTFPANELERLRKERLTDLLQARDDPAEIVRVAFPRLVFGARHRYGTPAVGTEASLEAIRLEDLRTFYSASYRPDNSTLIVVGDVTSAKLMPLLEQAFGGWRADGPPATRTNVVDPPQLTRRQIYLIDKPGAAQSQIRIGWIGVPRSTKEYATLQVLNTILGGSFTSRLNQNLREEHGYTYGAASTFDMRRSSGPFFATAGVQTDKTADALREFFNELNGIRKPIPADELDKAKNYVALGFPARFETTGDLARRLEELVVYGLPDDTFTAFVDQVSKVTAADVEKDATRYVQPDKFAVVIVGDRKAIEPGVRALNLGPLQLLSVEDVMATK